MLAEAEAGTSEADGGETARPGRLGVCLGALDKAICVKPVRFVVYLGVARAVGRHGDKGAFGEVDPVTQLQVF